MIFRAIDSNGDWQFGQGVGSYAVQNNAIAMNIKTRVLSWLNNCFFDLNAGIDWFKRLDRGQQDNLVSDLSAMITQSDGVVSLVSLDVELDRSSRRFVARYTVDTIFTQSFSDTLEAAVGLPVQ